MLSCSPLHTFTSFCQPLYFIPIDVYIPFFAIVFHKSKSCLSCDSSNCSCFKYIFLSEDFIHIFMCFALIFSGKIQINIRFLYLSRNPQKRFKRNGESFLSELCSTLFTVFFRHIYSTVIQVFITPPNIFAIWTYVMRRKRIYFRYTCHRRCKRRSN